MSQESLDSSNLIDSENEPVERTATALVEFAVQLGASDLFLLSDERALEVRVRHLGMMRTVRGFSLDYGRRLITYFKAMGGLDIANRLHPGEGRWVYRSSDTHEVDMRLNTIPTLHGEDLTCRLLDRRRGLLPLEALGLGGRALQDLRSLLEHPSGLILVTGPTGSGKTTTLYGCLQELNDGVRKINTLEDPIEYVLHGVRQSQVNLRMGVDFPHLLSACLRQAPDIIMIGEIRDAETARTAIRAANSGHLVLATLHAPLAAAAPMNLVNLGVNVHFLASSLLGVVSQRLLRKLCENCREPIDVSDHPTLFSDVRSLLDDGMGSVIYGPRGCDHCFQQGYVDRMCVTEIMTVNERLRETIVDSRPMQMLHERAIEEGMIELRRSALIRIAKGETSTEEMFRTVPFDYFEGKRPTG